MIHNDIVLGILDDNEGGWIHDRYLLWDFNGTLYISNDALVLQVSWKTAEGFYIEIIDGRLVIFIEEDFFPKVEPRYPPKNYRKVDRILRIGDAYGEL